MNKSTPLIAVYFLLLSSVNLMYGQKTLEKAALFSLVHEIVGQEFLFLEQKSTDQQKIIYSNIVFEIVQKTLIDGTSHAIIKPVKILKKEKYQKEKSDISLFSYYLVKASDLEDNLQDYTPRSWKMQVGIANIPVKLYFPHEDSPLDFSASSVSLGPTLGISNQVNQSKSNLWIHYLVSLNFTIVTPTDDDFFTNDFNGNSLSALSPAIGVALDYNNAQVGLFIGKDFLPGEAACHWKHNGETWFSLSIGLSLSSFNNKDQ